MKTILMSMVLAVAASLYPVVSMGGHVEGEEHNVVILHCAIDVDRKPHKIYVLASNINATQNPIPMVSENTPCAQALHELLTAGFEITESNLETLVFVLTRIDQSKHKH